MTAFASAVAGDLVYLRGGSYTVTTSSLTTAHSGTGTGNTGIADDNPATSSANRIIFRAYTGETPIISCSNVAGTSGGNIVTIQNPYWWLDGITFTGSNLNKSGNRLVQVGEPYAAQYVEVTNCIFNLLSSTSTDNISCICLLYGPNSNYAYIWNNTFKGTKMAGTYGQYGVQYETEGNVGSQIIHNTFNTFNFGVWVKHASGAMAISSNYTWTKSSRGTNEYYLTAAGGANPNLAAPVYVVTSGSTYYSQGTPGSLSPSVGQWGWGNNDSLGFSTIYARTPDDASPAYASGMPNVDHLWYIHDEVTSGAQIAYNYMYNVFAGVWGVPFYENIHDNLIVLSPAGSNGIALGDDSGGPEGGHNTINHNTIINGSVRLFGNSGTFNAYDTLTNNINTYKAVYNANPGNPDPHLRAYNNIYLAGSPSVVYQNNAYSLAGWTTLYGQEAHSLAGAPSFAGGASPSTVLGFALASGSIGKNAASDGKDIGADVSVIPGGSSGLGPVTGLRLLGN